MLRTLSTRLRLRFSLRAALVITGLLCALLAWRANGARAQREAVMALRRLRADVLYDFQLAKGITSYDAEPGTPPWLRATLGDDYFSHVVEILLSRTPDADDELRHVAALGEVRKLFLWDCQVTDRGLGHLQSLARLEHLDLDGTGVGDGGLPALAALTRLKILNLNETRVTDSGLDWLAALPRLETLMLERTALTDAGLAKLARVTSLRELYLNDTCITDEGLLHIGSLRGLRYVDVQRTQVTPDGIRRLEGAQPQACIAW
ncbi:MAG TPA: hypothetical protein VG125_14100 [Pirellulales bacterium]|nr:hypothetical protein [Pirellulales bacterium]